MKPVARAALHIGSVALAAFLTVAVTAGLAPARAEITLDFTESFALDWHWVLDDPQILDEADREDVVDLRNRLNARLKTGDWTFGLRLDMAWFPSPPTSQYASDLRPEEVFVTCKLSLNQLRESARRILTGNGGYLETAARVEQFKAGTLLPRES